MSFYASYEGWREGFSDMGHSCHWSSTYSILWHWQVHVTCLLNESLQKKKKCRISGSIPDPQNHHLRLKRSPGDFVYALELKKQWSRKFRITGYIVISSGHPVTLSTLPVCWALFLSMWENSLLCASVPPHRRCQKLAFQVYISARAVLWP